jgi:hypothetical protein
MASLIVIGSFMVIIGIAAGAFITVSFAIRRDDWALTRGFDTPGRAERSARALTGYSRTS